MTRRSSPGVQLQLHDAASRDLSVWTAKTDDATPEWPDTGRSLQRKYALFDRGLPRKADMMFQIAILDDYQGVALAIADWSLVESRAVVTVFHDHVDDENALIQRLLTFDAVCVMRERTPLTADHFGTVAQAEVHCFKRSTKRVD